MQGETARMTLHDVRRALFGADTEVFDQRIFQRVTVGAVSAWIAMGGDFLGSCVYGPDALARSSTGLRSLLVVSGTATLATLVILAYAYTRMIAQFPDGGGGYTAAKRVVGERVALVSGVALLVDAAFNVAVSVVTCVNAAADALPPAYGAARLPVALALIVGLTFVNLRGVRESVALLTPIVLAFVLSHVVVLGLAIALRLGALPAVVAAVPGDVHELAREHGTMGALGSMVRAYALGGAIYTGLESVSNGVPVLREPKVDTARRAMLLVAGIPAVVITTIIFGYVLFDVRPESDKTLNAVLFEHVAQAIGRTGPVARTLLVTVPLLSEAALLVVAAQTGFVDGPRVLGALAIDRYMPKRFTRLNGRLAPAPGILLIASIALVSTLVTGGSQGALLVVFVVSVFVTFTISQWSMLVHALRRLEDAADAKRDAALHFVALVLCASILVGTLANWPRGSVLALLLIGMVVGLATAIRRRYDAVARAVERVPEAAPSPQEIAERVAKVEQMGAAAAAADDAPVAVLLIGERTEFGKLALAWLATRPAGIARVVLASVSVLDAEAVQGEDRLMHREEQRRQQLELIAESARELGLAVDIELRRGADVLETAVMLVMDLMRNRSAPSIVVGFRSGLGAATVDPLLRDDLAVRLQARLVVEKIAMLVASIPLET
ncbi:MAG: amino acid permease-associated region [Labilithrix sp.]|nr:amino acid permease-associated region [Labilithrix sp.]